VVEGVEPVDDLYHLAGRGSTFVAVRGSTVPGTTSTILVSDDLGRTWSPEFESDRPLLSISMPDQRTIVAAGDGKIIRGRR